MKMGKRYEVAVYEKNSLGGVHYCVLDKLQPKSTYRLGYVSVYTGGLKAGCEIVANLLNEQYDIIRKQNHVINVAEKIINNTASMPSIIEFRKVMDDLE